MKRYIVVTNVWGKKWNIFHTGLKDYIKEEREEFDTMEEVNDYVNLFEGIYKDTKDNPSFKEPFEMWGYVVGDTNQFKFIKWGGTGMKHMSKGVRRNSKRIVKPVPHSNMKLGEAFSYTFHNFDSRMNNLYNKDYVFRCKDEIPANYRWDDGEYEGWLQFRWGDGTNAIGYVKPVKENKTPDDIVDFAEMEDPWFEQEHDENIEEIENSFLRDEDKEKLKKLADRW